MPRAVVFYSTFSVIATEPESEPLEPFTVTVYVPAGALLVVEMRRVEEFVVGSLLKLALTPEGSPLAESVTKPLNPPDGWTVIVSLELLPGRIESVEALAESVKLWIGAAFTCNAAELVAAPPGPAHERI